MMYQKLIKMLQHANAAEYGAYHAYVGHRDSVRSVYDKAQLDLIMQEEMIHIKTTSLMLQDLGAEPSPWRILFFTIVGKTLGKLCHYTGYKLPMWGAGVIEKMGRNGYRKIALEANRLGQPRMRQVLIEMAEVEEEHEQYFKGRL